MTSIKSSSAWVLGTNVVQRAFSLVVFIILAQVLDIIEFGMVAFCFLFVEFVTILINSGVREYLVTRKSANQTAINTCFILTMLLCILYVGFCLLIFLLFFQDNLSSDFRDIFYTLIWLPFFSSLNAVQIAKLQRDNKFKGLSLRSLVSTVIAGVVGVGLAFYGFGAWSLVVNKYVFVLLNSIVLLYISGFRPGLSFSVRVFKECLGFSFPLLLSETVNFWSVRVMELIVSIFFGPASFALLEIARKFFKLIQQIFLTPLRPICLAYVVKQKANKQGEFYSFFNSTVALAVSPVLILLGVYADSFIPVVFGEKWSASVPIVEILSFSAILQCITWYYNVVLITDKNTKLIFRLDMGFFIVAVVAGIGASQLGFSSYLIVQTAVFNLIGIAKIGFLYYFNYIKRKDITDYYVPVLVSLCLFVLIALVVERYGFEQTKLGNLLDLGQIALYSGFSIAIAGLVVFILFPGYFYKILNLVKYVKN